MTYEKYRKRIVDIETIVKSNGGIVKYIKEDKYLAQSQLIIDSVYLYKVKTVFMYTIPQDVVLTCALYALKGIVQRIQINLTDHAFWLGAKAIDKCLEFRDYGLFISNKYREIERESLYLVPYYPNGKNENCFEGFPFEYNPDKNILMFSGGALYKTIDDNKTYYKFVEELLNSYPTLIFWYAGDKSKYDQELERVMTKYPERVYRTEERKDLLEVLKRSDFYLDTYPIGGALMVQYAVLAKTIPIMVKSDALSGGILINQENLAVYHQSFDEAKGTIDRVINDNNYRMKLISEFEGSVIDEKKFSEQLNDAIDGVKKVAMNIPVNIDVANLREVYFRRFDERYLERYYFNKNNIAFLLSHPYVLFKGIVGRFFQRMRR